MLEHKYSIVLMKTIILAESQMWFGQGDTAVSELFCICEAKKKKKHCHNKDKAEKTGFMVWKTQPQKQRLAFTINGIVSYSTNTNNSSQPNCLP